jgi:hypothetical protein
MKKEDTVIYLIKGPKNLKYVGITRTTASDIELDGPVCRRFSSHVRSAHKKKTLLQKAISKYGAEKFKAEFLALASSRQEALALEQLYIYELDANLNMTSEKNKRGYILHLEKTLRELKTDIMCLESKLEKQSV